MSRIAIIDGYFERGLNPRDHAAGALLVTEAGGMVGGAGPGGTPSSDLIVATGAALFEELLAAALGTQS